MTIRTVLATIVIASVGAAAASAQEKRFELSGTLGYTFSDGVSGSATDRFGNEFSRIDPADAFSWNIRGGFLVNENLEVGALFGMQSSSLGITLRGATGGTGSDGNLFTIGDENIYNYHGYVAYNFGESKIRPYLLFGLGATQFGSVSVNLANVPVQHDTTQRDIGGSTKFSSIWAAGVKVNPSPNFGLRFEGRWTPTYIKSDAAGWWCDPYWGCYTLGDAQYANQFELGGGVTFRF
jgi:opacity protein-like surface antigen